MSRPPLPPSSKVSLEDLLHLKRAERPPPEFWTQFERDLHQKQLAALVARKSWWLELAAVYHRYGRLRLPVGAAAVLALSLLTVRHYGGWAAVKSAAGVGDTFRPAGQLAAVHALGTTRPARPAVSTRHSTVTEVAVATTANEPAEAPEATPARQEAAGEPSAVIPWLGDVVADRSVTADLKPSARSIAVHMAAVAALEPELMGAVIRPLGFEERAMPAVGVRHTAEVLPTAAAVTDSRRTRLLAALGAAGGYAPEPAAPEHSRRSAIRYLSDEGWDRSMGRLEAEGDKLSIKF